jgi:tetratricopeptide (TPR) repeat protein
VKGTALLLPPLAALCLAGCTQEPEYFSTAIELIHAYDGTGHELTKASLIARGLSWSHPKGGYAQTLDGELLSTWELNQRGEPQSLVEQIVQLTDEALRLNPKLAYAYVPRARAWIRASRYADAESAIDSALKLQPHLAGAIFLRAEIHRRKSEVPEAEAAYLKFIALSDKPVRKSNGYLWLAMLYQDNAWKAYVPMMAKARSAYEKSVELHPEGPWKNVYFAMFLNDDATDFEAAERYAAKALSIADFPEARRQLAFARYQKLLVRSARLSNAALRHEIAAVSASTRVPLDTAIDFAKGYRAIPARLQTLRTRASSG